MRDLRTKVVPGGEAAEFVCTQPGIGMFPSRSSEQLQQQPIGIQCPSKRKRSANAEDIEDGGTGGTPPKLPRRSLEFATPSRSSHAKSSPLVKVWYILCSKSCVKWMVLTQYDCRKSNPYLCRKLTCTCVPRVVLEALIPILSVILILCT